MQDLPRDPGITWREDLWFRLRALENLSIPNALRRVVVNGVLRGDAMDQRYRDIGDREVLFLHVPKTGGTSLAKALDLPYGHIPASRFHARDRKRFLSSFRFAFVRNPWERLYSAFNYLHSAIGLNASRDVRWATQNLGTYPDFEAFVLDLKNDATWSRIKRWPHFRAQTDWLCLPGSNELQLDFLGRFETLIDDAARLNKELGVTVTLPHERKSNAYGRKVFSDVMKGIIADRYRTDIDFLRYAAPV